MSYYRPFTTSNEGVPYEEEESEEEEADSDDSSDTDGFEDSMAKGLDDPRYAIIRAAGPSFETGAKQLFYQAASDKNQIVLGYPFVEEDEDLYDPSNDFVTNIPYLPFTPATTSTTSTLFSFNSNNRDSNAYPSPLFFTIKTPRIYKNVTQLQFTQINFPVFLNAIPDASDLFTEIATYVSDRTQFTFSNCYSCIGNTGSGRGLATSLNGGSFSEAGRTNPVNPANPLVHTFTLKGGIYEGGSMANEMDKQLNTTPPFNLISYAEHRSLFLANGTANHLFNDPGKWYYSPLSGTYVRNAVKSLVISDYLPNTRLAGIQPTERELFVAYFFPVLRSALHSANDSKFLNFGTVSLEEVKRRAVQTFESLSSPLYYDLCYSNVATLKSIRRVHTFEYHPINSYTYSYNHSAGKMLTTHVDLHPSLHKEIQSYYESSKLQAAASFGYTGRGFAQLQTNVAATGSTLTTVANELRTVLTEVGIPLYTYTNAQLASGQTPILLQSKKSLTVQQSTESEEALIALTVGAPPSLSPPPAIRRTFPAGLGWNTIQQLVQDVSNVSVAPRAFTMPYSAGLKSLRQLGFLDTYSTFVSYYSTNTSYIEAADAIQTQGLALTSNYVNTKYATVFPPSLLQDNAYLNGKGTGAVTFYSSKSIHYPSTPDDTNRRGLSFIGAGDGSGCCGFVTAAINNFYGCLPAEYVINTPFYKLGYGINDILSYYSTNSLTAKTTTNNIYIQLNEEYSLNTMDIGGNENLNISNGSAGQYKKVFGKILTQDLTAGAIAQTIVQIPARFPIAPLASLDHFSFNFFLDTMVPLNKLYPFTTGIEWNAIMQIDEKVAVFSSDEA